jgi:CBS domain-containing protein
MLVNQIMVKDVITIESDQSVIDACKTYKHKGVGCLVVMKESMVVGILTERDIIERVIIDQLNPRDTKVEEIMSRNIKTIHASASIEKAAEIMRQNKIKKLPVILNNEIVGIVTVTDIANILPNISRMILEEKEAFRFVSPPAE